MSLDASTGPQVRVHPDSRLKIFQRHEMQLDTCCYIVLDRISKADGTAGSRDSEGMGKSRIGRFYAEGTCTDGVIEERKESMNKACLFKF